MNKSTTPKLSITREPDGNMLEIVGRAHQIAELYGFLTQALIREHHMPAKLLEDSIALAGDLWDKVVDGCITLDKQAVLDQLKRDDD